MSSMRKSGSAPLGVVGSKPIESRHCNVANPWPANRKYLVPGTTRIEWFVAPSTDNSRWKYACLRTNTRVFCVNGLPHASREPKIAWQYYYLLWCLRNGGTNSNHKMATSQSIKRTVHTQTIPDHSRPDLFVLCIACHYPKPSLKQIVSTAGPM